MTILITGARGKVGQAVLAGLHAAGHTVRAASAKPAELTVPAGVEVAELDLGRPETFAAALRGVRQVFLYPEPAGIHELIAEAEAAASSTSSCCPPPRCSAPTRSRTPWRATACRSSAP
ncbi:SDR family oxidoreductase [Kitasatospora gansuensis]